MNGLLCAQKLQQAKLIAGYRDDIGPLIATAARLWEKAVRGEYNNLHELRQQLDGTVLKLTQALQSLDAIDRLAVVVPAAENGSPLKQAGATGEKS